MSENDHQREAEAAAEAERLLGALRDFAPQGLDTVDPARAVRTGRRKVRVRRAAGSAAGALAVIVIVLVSTLLGRAGFGTDPGPEPGPAGPPGERFDDRRQEFRVGSGGGFTPASYEPGAFVQRIVLRPEVPNGPLRGADGLVLMYPKGHLPDGLAGGEPQGPAVEAVHGRRAVRLAPALLRPGAVELAWEWKPGAWGFVSLKGPGVTEVRARHVAESVLPAA
ncbi:hypothetical protein [Actinomadura sp. 6N118]|uniref:hypothetical protein n=1 Tax=Actinomadura sp. 6N118 TaxID=3375151 RepID=UPI00378E33A0